MFDCKCAPMKDPADWHRRRDLALCAHALDVERARGREKYRRAQEAKGLTVRPYAGGRRPTGVDGWVPGSPILVPEIDPL